MPEVITNKVAIGVSACIYGCPVRYNGRAFDALRLLGRERADFAWTPVCPECLAGLGVPRMPIHLTGTGQDVLAGDARVRDRRGRDVTERVVEGSRSAIEALERAGVEAFVAKESSPTCGLYKARVGKRRTETGGGSGVFGAMLIERGWFLIPDQALANPLSWWDWRRRLHAWLWLKRRELGGAHDIYDAWHILKFIIQETDRPLAESVGRRLAALPKRPAFEEIEQIRGVVLDALRRPSTKPRIRAAAWKTFAHMRKKGRLGSVDMHGLDVAAPGARADVERVAADLLLMERISFENDLLFGTSPVVRRDARRVRDVG